MKGDHSVSTNLLTLECVTIWHALNVQLCALCINLVPRALFPGFGGGAGKAPPLKPGKSALGTRLTMHVHITNREGFLANLEEF